MESIETEDLPLPLEQAAAFTPEALRAAMTKYHERAGADTAMMTAKEFVDHQKACQSAVAHIELLVKLALRAQLPDADGDSNRAAVTAALLHEAMKDVKEFDSQ